MAPVTIAKLPNWKGNSKELSKGDTSVPILTCLWFSAFLAPWDPLGCFKDVDTKVLYPRNPYLIGLRGSQRRWNFISSSGDFGIDMYILLYLKWMTNKELLYSTWNSAQCYVAAWLGGEFGREWIHVYVWLSHSAV